MARSGRLPALAACLALAGALLGACADSSSGIDSSRFTEQQKAGMKIAQTGGCQACHGPNFKGASGPSLVGLAGSQVTLVDGTTVTADDAYLAESITDPGAKKVKGYSMAMPSNSLSDTDVANLVAFIKALTK